MKILQLRFKNLNSLYGEWLIDFTAPEYQSNGIFALTGPTGSGKSTILDAICLALYGTTPRLGKITKSANDIMSRQTGECYAEVTFAAQSGHFRCHWSQHKSHKKALGKLVDSKHEIADARSGQILASKKREVAGVIEEKTGMDFERFTRSILLAQGGFDTFLKADVEQKSKVLEQITGTDIYSKISLRVHERHRDEQEKLALLQAKISGISLLSEQQEGEINSDLAENEKQEIAITGQLQKAKNAQVWLTGIHNLKQDVLDLAQKNQQQNQLIEAFESDRKKLLLALKAAELDAVFARLSLLREQQKDDKVQLIQKEQQLPEIETSRIKHEALVVHAKQLSIQAKAEQEQSTPLIQKIRLLDQELSYKKNTMAELNSECQLLSTQLTDHKTQQKKIQAKLKKADKKRQSIADYLTTHSADALLVSEISAIEAQLKHIIIFQNEISANKKLLITSKKKLQASSKKLIKHSQILTSDNENLKKAELKLSDNNNKLSQHLGSCLLREYRTEKENLLREMSLLNKIVALENDRKKLENGKPCPLCGSQAHPYAEGNIPEQDATEKKIDKLTQIINKAEKIQLSIVESQQTEKEASVTLSNTEKQAINLTSQHENAEKIVSDLTNEIAKQSTHWDTLKADTLAKLEPLGLLLIANSDIQELLSSLKTRLAHWQKQSAEDIVMEKQYATLNNELEKIALLIDTQEQLLTEKNNAYSHLNNEYSTHTAQRVELFGNKKTDEEEARLKHSVGKAEDNEKQLYSEYDTLLQQVNTIKNNILTLSKQIAAKVNELEHTEEEFCQALTQANFSDEQLFLSVRLSIIEREKLREKAKELDNKKIEIQGRKKDRQTQLDLELNKKITTLEATELEQQHNELDSSVKTIIRNIASLTQQLSDNKETKARIKDNQLKIEAQNKEYRKWAMLHTLIGSSDGKKFRTFAQGLTFELMVSHANKQLKKMTDRYLLIRDDAKPLELNVMDNYQLGEIRPTKNLSGGESFIVSLSLALGLSKMASHKVRVDSLFLDEGFGTLDEDALETALETLSGLQQGGKLIGIISHVPALKERISTQINVTPLSGGRSTMTGPGCRKVSHPSLT